MLRIVPKPDHCEAVYSTRQGAWYANARKTERQVCDLLDADSPVGAAAVLDLQMQKQIPHPTYLVKLSIDGDLAVRRGRTEQLEGRHRVHSSIVQILGIVALARRLRRDSMAVGYLPRPALLAQSLRDGITVSNRGNTPRHKSTNSPKP